MAEPILALDVRSREEALRLLDRIPEVGWVKVGSILMTAEGPSLIRELVARSLSVFLDLKWHDIPTTVSGSVAVAGELGVRMATVHASGGTEMLRAAADAAPEALSLVGVTVLTSQSTATDQVGRLARVAMESGLAGVVCSPLEVASVRAALGAGPLIVVPGIRQPGDHPDDQQRTATAGFAARAGATHLVVGRTVTRAPDPRKAWQGLQDELR